MSFELGHNTFMPFSSNWNMKTKKCLTSTNISGEKHTKYFFLFRKYSGEVHVETL